MVEMIVLRDFRLTDQGKQLKSGEKVEFDDEYYKSSRALKAAKNAGWIDESSLVSEDDPRMIKTEKVTAGKKRTLHAPISDEDKQFQMDVEGAVASPGLKKQAQAQTDATAAALQRAKMRLDRLKNGETPVDFKPEDAADEVVGADVGVQLATRRQHQADAEKNFRQVREDQAKAKIEALEGKPATSTAVLNSDEVVSSSETTIKEEVRLRVKRTPRVPRVKKLDKVD